MKRYDLSAIAQEIHANAVAHGWWETERPFHEIIILIHSEWSEALEEYRAGRPMEYVLDIDGPDDETQRYETDPEKFKGRKPEGIAVELIDGVIRMLDWMASVGESCEFETRDININTLTELIYECHKLTTKAGDSQNHMAMWTQFAIFDIFSWLEREGMDPMQIILRKHEYNKCRPYKHGGKVI